MATIKKEYIKYKELDGKNIIVKNEESFKKEFFCWVKEKESKEEKKEKENKIQKEENKINLYKLYEEHLQEDKGNILENEDKNLKIYFSKLFDDLTLMYFHCDISFPSVSINFKSEENFDSDKMIDF